MSEKVDIVDFASFNVSNGYTTTGRKSVEALSERFAKDNILQVVEGFTSGFQEHVGEVKYDEVQITVTTRKGTEVESNRLVLDRTEDDEQRIHQDYAYCETKTVEAGQKLYGRLAHDFHNQLIELGTLAENFGKK